MQSFSKIENSIGSVVIRNFTVKENNMGSVVIKIPRYRQKKAYYFI